MPLVHAKLSASGSHRWLTCPASIQATQKYENKSNPMAEWGTACHGVGELLLMGKEIPEVVEGLKVDDDEMMEVASEYANYCRGLINEKSEIMIEHRMDFSHIVPEGFGTGDFTCLTDGVLHVVDLKTGFNIVSADDNPQLKLYAIGAIRELEFMYDLDKVVLHIVQTRAGSISTWETDVKELSEWGEWVKDRAELALSDNPPFNPEHKACMYCPHQANCEALRSHVDNVIKGEFDDITDVEDKADIISDIHIKQVLDNADLIKNFLKAVETLALERLQDGKEIDGYKLVESRTNRKWTDEEAVEAYLKSRDDGIDYYQAPKLKPMGQILKVLKDDEKIQELVFKPKGTPTIAKASDKRKAINAVCDEFNKI